MVSVGSSGLQNSVDAGGSEAGESPFTLLAQLRPQRVLSIGRHSERWGRWVQESCDVWFSEPERATASPPVPSPVPVGQALAVLGELSEGEGGVDLVLFGEELAQCSREQAMDLVGRAIEEADYVLLDVVPWQRSPEPAWSLDSLARFPLVMECRFAQGSGTGVPALLYSEEDPRQLQHADSGEDLALQELRAPWVGRLHTRTSPLAQFRDQRLEELQFELDFLKACRPVRRILRSPHRTVRSLGRWRKSGVEIESLTERHGDSSGTRVELLKVSSEVVRTGLPWYFFDGDGSWIPERSEHGAYGRALVSERPGFLRCVLRGHRPRLSFLTGPDAGKVKITRRGHEHLLDLYSAAVGKLEFDPKTGRWQTGTELGTEGRRAQSLQRLADETFESMRIAGSELLGVVVEGPFGVDRGFALQFPHLLPLPAHASEDALDHWARRIVEEGVRHVVLAGTSSVERKLAERLHRASGTLRIDALWTAGLASSGRVVSSFDSVPAVLELVRSGVLHKLGVRDLGFIDWWKSLGVRACPLLPPPLPCPTASSRPDDGGPHVGLWSEGAEDESSWFAAIASLKLLRGVRLRGCGASIRAMEFAETCGLSAERLESGALAPGVMAAHLSSCHVNLSLGVNNARMIFLESLSLGTPCLVRTHAWWFDGNPLLRQRLHFDPSAGVDRIAQSIRAVLEQRDDLIVAYAQWAPRFAESSLQCLHDFLD